MKPGDQLDITWYGEKIVGQGIWFVRNDAVQVGVSEEDFELENRSRSIPNPFRARDSMAEEGPGKVLGRRSAMRRH